MRHRQRIAHIAKVILIISINLAAFPISAEIIQHPHVLIPFEGELAQDIRLTEDEWGAIILAVSHSIERVKAAVVAVDRKNYNDARSIIKSALHLLTLVKIATPSFEIVTHSQTDNSIIKLQSLLLKIQDPNGKVRIYDVLLMKSNLENALFAMDSMDAELVRLFLTNASKSSWSYE